MHPILPSQDEIFIYAHAACSLTSPSRSHSPSIFTLEAKLFVISDLRVCISTVLPSAMRSSMFHLARCEDHYNEPHFLEACFLCRKPLGLNSDIFMYRGNTPFCSKECRQEQIEIDEVKEKGWKRSSAYSSSSPTSSSNRGIRKSDTNNDSTTPTETVRTGAVVVA